VLPPPQPPANALAALLPPDVSLDGLWRHEAAQPVWYGVVWGRLGRGDLAWAHFDRVGLPELGPWIAAERGRIVRELGLHAAAEAMEWPALVAAHDHVDEAMLRISLVADAVGVGEGDLAVRRLEAATTAVSRLLDRPRASRQRLRLSWVEVEVAFLTGRAPDPTKLPWWDVEVDAPAFPVDYTSGSVFHRAKGLLFGGVVRDDLRLLDAAAPIAPPVLLWGVHLARADAGVAGALTAAQEAWARMVPPPGYGDAVAATPTARRLARG
jgi:hypothetical protein